ncbi:MAG: hypothetical protein ACRDRJ_11170 [Streptosporangiaceae bacterium]
MLAGPSADDSGALLIFTADRSRVRQIVRDDPYYTTPGVTVLGLRDWAPHRRPAVADAQPMRNR